VIRAKKSRGLLLRLLVPLARILPQRKAKTVLDDASEGASAMLPCSVDEPFNVCVRSEAEQWAWFCLGVLIHSFNDLMFKRFSNPLQYLF
jgi:hypothetical protein